MLTRLLPYIAFAAACLAACTEPEPDPPYVHIRVLLAYSESETGDLEVNRERAREMFQSAAAIFENSGTLVVPEIAGIRAIPFEPSERVADLQALVRKRDGRMDMVHAIRDSVQADIVVLFSSLPNAAINGSVLASEATAFVVAAWDQADAPDYGLAHELAHLFGAMHPGETGPVPAQLPAGFSWGEDSIRTVMDWGPGKTVPYFSNPGIRVGGQSIGVAAKQDIASVIRTTAAYVSNFRGPKTVTAFVPAGTIPSADFSE